MDQTIQNFPKQFLIGYDLVGSPPHPSPLPKGRGEMKGKVYLAGMGGSALPGDLINDYLGEGTLKIVRDYRLPQGSPSPQPSPVKGEGNLVLCASYSGNTEETLAAFEAAKKRKAKVIVLTHGGQLKERALKEKIPLIEIPECIQPRCASGYFFSAILGILEKVGMIKGERKVRRELEKLATFLEKRRGTHEEEGKKLAKILKGKVPIIYGPSELEGTCRVIKIKFNENSKVPSFYNVFPELNHNEMVGFTNLIMNPVILYLKSRFMHPRILRRMEVMQELLGKKISFYSINLQGENRLQEIFDAQAVADYASYHLALEYGVDPAAVEMVENFKKKLGRFSFGCMEGSIKIIGDIINPACDEEEWEVLRDDEKV